jgi:hypothetical protein
MKKTVFAGIAALSFASFAGEPAKVADKVATPAVAKKDEIKKDETKKDMAAKPVEAAPVEAAKKDDVNAAKPAPAAATKK